MRGLSCAGNGLSYNSVTRAWAGPAAPAAGANLFWSLAAVYFECVYTSYPARWAGPARHTQRSKRWRMWHAWRQHSVL